MSIHNSPKFPIKEELTSGTDSPSNVKKTSSGNLVERMVLNTDKQPNNLKNLYQNIGTRVSKLREINEAFQHKIKGQKQEMDLLNERIVEKKKLLDFIREQKKSGNSEWFNDKYKDMCQKNEIKMKVNINHVQNDPGLKKVYHDKEKELSELQNKLNTLTKKTEHVTNEINTLRVENSKNEATLEAIIYRKDEQSKQMDKISEEANKYLKEKGQINKELVELNEKIENNKNNYETKIQELNKMIDNTKKIKEFHETLAIEKFAKNSFRKTTFGHSSVSKPTSKLSEEEKKLEELKQELKKRKRVTVYLNFSRIILLKNNKSYKI